MLIDLSTLPPTVSVDECPGSLVVRSWATMGVNGLLCRTAAPQYTREGKSYYQELKPGARLAQGEVVCLETMVPLPQDPPVDFCFRCRGAGCSRCAASRVKVYDEPWEVATGARDIVTGRKATWRATLHVQRHPRNEALWLVGVGRSGETTALVRLATKNLSFSAPGVQFPLRQFAQAEALPSDAPPTLWDRLSEDE